jgi:genome maintenance exonuclease 1
MPHDVGLVSSIETSFGRFYRSPRMPNYWYPSVTTVTGFSKSEFFAEWRKNPDNERLSKHASNRGNELHSMIESYLKNETDYKKNKNLLTVYLFQQMQEELHKINNIHMQETPMWSDTLRMAGRVDCVAEYDGVLSIIDFKGSGKQKREEWITNYFEQASCYSLMYQEMTGTPVNQIVIMITSEDGTVQIFKKNPKEYFKSLNKTIKDFWKANNFNDIQNKIKEI